MTIFCKVVIDVVAAIGRPIIVENETGVSALYRRHTNVLKWAADELRMSACGMVQPCSCPPSKSCCKGHQRQGAHHVSDGSCSTEVAKAEVCTCALRPESDLQPSKCCDRFLSRYCITPIMGVSTKTASNFLSIRVVEIASEPRGASHEFPDVIPACDSGRRFVDQLEASAAGLFRGGLLFAPLLFGSR
jgi:hypothetical protein